MRVFRLLSNIRNKASFNRDTSFTVDILFFDWLAIPATKLISKVKWVHPNLVTVVSGILGLLAGYFYFRHDFLLGFILMYFSMLLDCVDGNLARLTKKTSKIGAALDELMDKLKKIVALFALWYVSSWNPYLLLSLIFLHYLLIRFFKNDYSKPKIEYFTSLGLVSILEPYDYMVLLLLFGPIINFEIVLIIVIILQIIVGSFSRIRLY